MKKYKESFEEASFLTKVLTQIGIFNVLFASFISYCLGVKKSLTSERNRDGYVPLYDFLQVFTSRYLHRRLKEILRNVICSAPRNTVIVKNRITYDGGWTLQFTGETTNCINFVSYNFLGNVLDNGPDAKNIVDAIEKYGISSCSSRREFGTNPLHIELEALTAKFLGTEDAIVCGMGFAANALNLPALLSPGCLVLSDRKNHASINLGLKISGATVKIFKHNDAKDLDKIIEESLITGQPRTNDPWKKIFIVTEGIFSMDGTILNLQQIIKVKKKYGAYIYIDEAHSIGSIGQNGRGVTDFTGVDPKDVDIFMGTFSKAFASCGGYICGSKKLINLLRISSHDHCYANSMSPAVAQQILTSMKILMGLDGTDRGRNKIDQLARNTRYFRKRLAQIGVITYGHEDSPVVPMLIYSYSKAKVIVQEFLKRKIAIVGVGYPATDIDKARIRFCISSSHTKEQLDYVLKAVDEISDFLGLKHSRKTRDPNLIEY